MASLDEDEDPKKLLAARFNAVRRFRNTLYYVWSDRKMLLCKNEAAIKGLPQERKPLPPVKFFITTITAGLIIQNLLFSPEPFEIPSELRFIQNALTIFIGPVTIISIIALCMNAALPWMAGRLIRRPIPFVVLFRASAYQQGGILLPPLIILEIAMFFVTYNSPRPSWFDYGGWGIFIISLYSLRWLFKQIKDECYSRKPIWIGVAGSIVLYACIDIFGLLPRQSNHIPSQSMLPTILVGDVIVTNRWVFYWREPKAGELVAFHADGEVDYISRIIGLPRDTVQLINGSLYVNGAKVPKMRISDFEIDENSITQCISPQFQVRRADGAAVCRYPRFRETLPSGKNYEVLDLFSTPQDDTLPIIVPDHHYFLLGDNRDNVMDSRFPAVPGAGIGMVSRSNLVGPVFDRLIPVISPKID